jgi:hypothetical protein
MALLRTLLCAALAALALLASGAHAQITVR